MARIRRPIGWAIVLLLAVLGGGAAARHGSAAADRLGDEPGARVLGHIGGRPAGLVAAGRYLYWAVGARVLVVDTSVPGQPRQVGASPPLPGQIWDLSLGANTLVVALGPAGTWALDLADPLRPRLAGSVRSTGRAISVVSVADTAFVVERREGQAEPDLLRVLSFAQPDAPQEMGRYLSPYPINPPYGIGGQTTLVATGGIVWLSNGDPRNRVPVGLVPLDVADPARIKLAGPRLPARQASFVALGARLAVLEWGSAELQLYDVSDPRAPRLQWSGQPWQSVGWTSTRAMWGQGNRLLVAGGGEDGPGALGFVDITDPTAPRWAGMTGSAPHVAGVAADGERVWISSDMLWPAYTGGLWETRVAAEAPRLGVVESPAPNLPAGSAFVWPGRVIINEGTVDFFDVSDGANPRLAHRLTTAGYAEGVYPLRDRLLVRLNYTETYDAASTAAQRIDLSDPDHPRVGGTLRMPMDIRGTDGNDLVFVVPRSGTSLELYQVPPTGPAVHLGTVELPSTPTIIRQRGARLYLRLEDAVGAVDIADPSAPRFLGQVELAKADSVEASDDYLFATTLEALVVFALTPAGIGQPVVTLPGIRGDLLLDGDRLLAHGSKLQVVDVRAPCRPRLLHTLDADGWPAGVDGDQLYTISDAGLFVLGLPPRPTEPVGACATPESGRLWLPWLAR
jgi:hypothetical protein